MPSTLPNSNPLSYLGVQAENPPTVVRQSRSPLTTDTSGGSGPFPLGTIWIDTQIRVIYSLVASAGNVATWSVLGGGVINGGFPITPFVVGPVGQAGYQTIQAGIDAAVAAGGVSQSVWVQPDTYTEDLDFSGATALGVGLTLVGATALGDEGQLEIIGTHTPPLTGTLVVRNFRLSSPTAIFSSTAAGSAELVLIDMELNVTNGFTFDLINWTGTFELFDINPGAADDGGINNTGGANFFMFSAGLGMGIINTMQLSGFTLIGEADIGCPVNFGTGSVMQVDVCQFGGEVNFGGNSNGELNNCRFTGGTDPGIVMGSSGNIQVSQALVQSSNNPAIDGAGAGTLTLGDIIFSNNSNVTGAFTQVFADALQGETSLNGNLSLNLPATQIQMEGGAATDFIGTVVLAAGTATIANTNIAASDQIFLQHVAPNASVALGTLNYTITAGVSFTINALDAGGPAVVEVSDISTVSYHIVRLL